MIGIELLVAAFLGSGVAKVLSGFLAPELASFLFPAAFNNLIPSFGTDMAVDKSYDLLNFILTISLIGSIFLINRLIYKKASVLVWSGYLVFALLFFLQTHFIYYSGKSVMLTLVVSQIALIGLSKEWFIFKYKGLDIRVFLNGLLVGYWLLLICNQITTAVVISLSMLVLGPLIYLSLKDRFNGRLASPVHLMFAAGIFFLGRLEILVGLGMVVGLAIVGIGNKLNKDLIYKYLYPVVIIFLVGFDPNYAVGNFDSVEEGFWLAWIERLRQGEALYKDTYVYHPPLLIWGANLFQKIVGYSMVNTRLFFQILEVVGLTIFYFCIKAVINSNFYRLVVMILVFALTNTVVRNNVEIRVAVGLLNLVLWSGWFNHKQGKFLVWSGAVAAISLFVSIEVGLAVLVASGVGGLLFARKKFGAWVLGWSLVALPAGVFLGLSGSLVPMVEQLRFYATAFSEGYFNSAVDRSINQAFLHWHMVNQYLSSTAWLWEVARGGLAMGGILALYKWIKKEAGGTDKIVLLVALFGLIIFRSALGRSDYYHLLFPLTVALIVIFYFIENAFKNRAVAVGVGMLFLLVISRDQVNANFFEQKLYTLQTLGKNSGEYKQITSSKAGIKYGPETDIVEITKLIRHIDENTSEREKIFTYPWMPELYFLTSRGNATKFDLPYAFFTEKYQLELIEELVWNNPKYVIFNPQKRFGGLVPDSLPLVYRYILDNYETQVTYGENQVMTKKL